VVMEKSQNLPTKLVSGSGVARECMFCASQGTLEVEHVSPDWLQGVLEKITGQKFIPDAYIEVTSSAEENGVIVRESKRPPYTAHEYPVVTYRGICGPCNRFMGVIQGRAKPILVPMIEGRPSTLSRDDLHTITLWSAMTMITLHARNNAQPAIPRDIRYAFRQHLTIPPQFAVFAACVERTPILHSWRPLDNHWREKSENLHFNFTTSTFHMNTLVLQAVRVIKPEPREQGMSVKYNTQWERLIYPFPDEFFWPPQYSLTNEEMLMQYAKRMFRPSSKKQDSPSR